MLSRNGRQKARAVDGPSRTQAGYDALYTQKSREAMGAAGKVDGCAVLWKTSKCRPSGIKDEAFRRSCLGARRGAAQSLCLVHL